MTVLDHATACRIGKAARRVGGVAVERSSDIDTTSALTGATARRTLSLEERVHRLDGEAFEGREAKARDDRPVLTTHPSVLESGDLLFDLDVGQVEPRSRGEVHAQRHAREVTVRIHGQLVVGQRAERLSAEPDRVRNRDRQREFRVQPLDLDQPDGVCVDVEGGVAARALATTLNDTAGEVAPRVEERVVVTDLAV